MFGARDMYVLTIVLNPLAIKTSWECTAGGGPPAPSYVIPVGRLASCRVEDGRQWVGQTTKTTQWEEKKTYVGTWAVRVQMWQ